MKRCTEWWNLKPRSPEITGGLGRDGVQVGVVRMERAQGNGVRQRGGRSRPATGSARATSRACGRRRRSRSGGRCARAACRPPPPARTSARRPSRGRRTSARWRGQPLRMQVHVGVDAGKARRRTSRAPRLQQAERARERLGRLHATGGVGLVERRERRGQVLAGRLLLVRGQDCGEGQAGARGLQARLAGGKGGERVRRGSSAGRPRARRRRREYAQRAWTTRCCTVQRPRPRPRAPGRRRRALTPVPPRGGAPRRAARDCARGPC